MHIIDYIYTNKYGVIFKKGSIGNKMKALQGQEYYLFYSVQ